MGYMLTRFSGQDKPLFSSVCHYMTQGMWWVLLLLYAVALHADSIEAFISLSASCQYCQALWLQLAPTAKMLINVVAQMVMLHRLMFCLETLVSVPVASSLLGLG